MDTYAIRTTAVIIGTLVLARSSATDIYATSTTAVITGTLVKAGLAEIITITTVGPHRLLPQLRPQCLEAAH